MGNPAHLITRETRFSCLKEENSLLPLVAVRITSISRLITGQDGKNSSLSTMASIRTSKLRITTTGAHFPFDMGLERAEPKYKLLKTIGLIPWHLDQKVHKGVHKGQFTGVPFESLELLHLQRAAQNQY